MQSLDLNIIFITTLLFYSQCYICICVPSFGTFLVFPVSRPIVPRGVLGGAGWGGPCLARRRLRPRTWCYPGVQFNLVSQSRIPCPSMAPVTEGDWGAELHGSSVSRTSVLGKEVIIFWSLVPLNI